MQSATHCDTMQYTAQQCNTLQNAAHHCNILQHTWRSHQKTQATTVKNARVVVTATSATHYSNTLQHTAMHMAHSKEESGSTCEDTAGSRESDEGNTLQHTTTHCNTLQHTATHCTPLHRTATSMPYSTEDSGNNSEQPAGSRDGDEHNTLQPTAAHCNTLQHTRHVHQKTQTTMVGKLQVVGTVTSVTHCDILRHTATHCNTHDAFTRRQRQ